jgi:hypothetical protein
MKITITILFLILFQRSFAQTETIAFVDIDTIANTFINGILTKFQTEYNEELLMMQTILDKKKIERSAETDEKRKAVLDADLAEYENRISERKDQIKEDLAKKAIELRDYRIKVEQMAAKVTKKKMYDRYIDISKDKPDNYNSDDDLTEQVRLKLK